MSYLCVNIKNIYQPGVYKLAFYWFIEENLYVTLIMICAFNRYLVDETS